VYLGRIASLSTLSRKQPGFPFGSVMPYGLDDHERPIFLKAEVENEQDEEQVASVDLVAEQLKTSGVSGEDERRGLTTLITSLASTFCVLAKVLKPIPHLERAGVTFMPLGTLDKGFTGTAIVATKNQRDHINNVRFAALKRKPNIYMTTRFGTQRPEWAEIPDSISLKVGARVMVLRNLYEFGNLVQSNGDMGIVRELFGDTVLVE
jgi:hypothetical protein